MLQVRRKPHIQSRLGECCQMCQLQWPTHGWLTGMSSEDFLSSREGTTRRRGKRNQSATIILVSLFSCSTIFDCPPNDGSSCAFSLKNTESTHSSSVRSKRSIIRQKEEIGRSQEILLNRITQLEEKCNAVHEQQAALRWTIETQIVPYMSTMSELLIDVCEQLATVKVVTLADQQQTKIHSLRHLPTMYHSLLSPSILSSGFSIAHLNKTHQQPSSLASSQ